MAINEIDIKNVESLPEYTSESSQIKVPAEKLRQLGLKAKDRLDVLKEMRSTSKYEEERRLDFDAYHMNPPLKPLPYAGYPNMACPLPRIGTDTFHANVMFTFAGQDGEFKVLPDFLSHARMDSAKRAADYMTYVLNYESGLYDALDKASMDSNKYENGFLKPRYVRQEEIVEQVVEREVVVPVEDPVTGQVTREVKKSKRKEKIRKVVFDGTKVERISPTCIYASPIFETVKEAVEKDYLFEVHPYSVRYLEENTIAPEGEDSFFTKSAVEKVKDVRRQAIISRHERNKQNYDGIMVERELELMPIELAEAHFRTDIDGDGLAEKVSMVFDTETGTVLRISFAKCRIVKLTPRPVDGRWDGESIRKVSSSVVLEWEAIHNQRVAKGQWSNLPFFFYKSGGRFNPQTLTLMPGKGYPLESPQEINFPQPPPPDSSYFNEEKLLLDYFDRILALGDVIQGVTKGTDASATNTIQSAQRAGIRLASPINRIGLALEELVGHIWDLNKLCAPSLKEYKVAGVGNGVPVFNKISRNDYDTQVGFKLRMATEYDVQMLRDSALLNYRTAITNPLVMNDPAALYDLTNQTFMALGLKIKMQVPDQAKAKSPFEVIDLIQQGETYDPMPGIDPEEHLAALTAFMESEDFEDWDTEQRAALYLYFDKVQILKQSLQAGNLNNAGIFEGMNGPGNGGATPPTMTANRNPTQKFNTMRVSNSPQSMRQNMRNGGNGADVVKGY